MFEEIKVKKVFQLAPENAREPIITTIDEIEAKKMAEQANKNIAYMKKMREGLISRPDWKGIMEDFEENGKLPEDFYKYFMLCYFNYDFLAKEHLFKMDYETNIEWMEYETNIWVALDKREVDEDERHHDWVSCGCNCYILNTKDYYKLYIGDDPQHRSVKIPKDYSYEEYKKEMSVRHTRKEMAENPVLDRIEQILTFEEHRIIFCELD